MFNAESMIASNREGASADVSNLTFHTTSGSLQERVRITAAGNVGIGVTAPTDALQVKSEGSDDGIALIKSNNTNQIVKLIETGTGDGALIAKNTSNAQCVLIRAQGNSYLNGGNVGIGDTSPSFELVVSSSAAAEVAISSEGQDSVLYFMNDAAQVSKIGYDLSHKGLNFVTDDQAFGSGEFFISSSGNVGIGTITPSAPLHVNPSSGGNGEIFVERTSGTKLSLQAQSSLGVIGTNTNHDLAFKTNSSVHARLTTSGRFGIGTSAPSKCLTVAGDISGSGDLYIKSDNIYLGDLETRIKSYNSYLGFFKSGGSAQPIKVGGIAITGDYTDTHPANGIFVTGDISASACINVNTPSALHSSRISVNGDIFSTGGVKVGTSSTFVGKMYNSSGVLNIESDTNRDIQ
jgi:hypothetical protein